MTPKLIEDAIIATLDAGANKAFYVQRYEGAAGSLDELANWMAGVQTPAIAVFYRGAEGEAVDECSRGTRRDCRFEVWVIHNRLRNYETAMVEPGGIYEILEEITTLLQGQTLKLDGIQPLSWLSENEVAMETGSGRVAWGQVWQTSYNRY